MYGAEAFIVVVWPCCHSRDLRIVAASSRPVVLSSRKLEVCMAVETFFVDLRVDDVLQ